MLLRVIFVSFLDRFRSKVIKMRPSYSKSHRQKTLVATDSCSLLKYCDELVDASVIALDYLRLVALHHRLNYVTKEMSPSENHPTPAVKSINLLIFQH